MLVTFISQCQKKALKRTRRVLDAFANRIGDDVWQTAITEEGLDAVRKLLSKTASKSTAVACHRVRSRQRTELVWIVGNRRKFNELGVVPVNYTENEVDMYQDDYRWRTLPLIKGAAVIAALFHDMGKATKLFQNKIDPKTQSKKNYEPYRHEWISLRLFEAFVLSSKEGEDVSDEEWITRFADGDFDNIRSAIRDDKATDNKNPLKSLPPFAQLVGWLILSHHRLPVFPHWEDNQTNPPSFSEIELWFDNKLSSLWNSHKCQSDEEKDRLDDNWQFLQLAYQSKKWAGFACLAIDKDKLLSQIKGKESFLHKDLFTTHIARLALMMSDHYVSAFNMSETYQRLEKYKDKNYKVFANTDYQDDEKVYKQQLDQHLIGVAIEAEKICNRLPSFKNSLPSLTDNDLLDHIISKKETESNSNLKHFTWQNDAIKTTEKIAKNTVEQGFFGINMASTGKGKTRANAKIMYALGQETGQIRFNVALGLRTLTLQTGKEFQEDLNIADKDISIAVGGIAVKELFEKQQDNANEQTGHGSESADDILNSEYMTDYATDYIDKHPLYEWTTKHHAREKHRINKLIQPPVLVCTIDHLIPATEGIRGGQQIAPMLRLLTSDLILDEPDDFGLDDLPALCRLVHWAGLLGRRVLLSTATMPPPLVYACFDAYKAGWSRYAKTNLGEWNGNIQCAWFDEFNTKEDLFNEFQLVKKSHAQFVNNRIKKLEQQPAKRKGKIVNICESKEQSVYQNMADTIFTSINELHYNHYISRKNKNVSIGLVRMANIDPMVAVAKNLLAMDAPENTHIHYVVYHGRYPLAIRSYIEEKLDYILKRKDSDRLWESEKGIGDIVNNSDVNNHIFVVLASPVAEVGRDHDYDWAVIEPSSMRSIVQIAGRVLRHRDICPEKPNIHLLNKNIKGLLGEKICFIRPGFESGDELKVILKKETDDDLNTWLKESEIANISANAKIEILTSLKTYNGKYVYLSQLEQKAIFKKLNGKYKNEKDKKNDTTQYVESAKPWWNENIHWTGELQNRQKFRKSAKDIILVRYLKSELDPIEWKEKADDKYHTELEEIKSCDIDAYQDLALGDRVSFWYDIDEEEVYLELLEKLKQYDSLENISKHFGKVTIAIYGKKPDIVQALEYHPQFGLYRVKG